MRERKILKYLNETWHGCLSTSENEFRKCPQSMSDLYFLLHFYKEPLKFYEILPKVCQLREHKIFAHDDEISCVNYVGSIELIEI